MVAYVTTFICPIGKLKGQSRLQEEGSYQTIHARNTCKRINKLDICDGDVEIDESEDVTIAIDSTGIKVTNRGQWPRDKSFVRRKAISKYTLQ